MTSIEGQQAVAKLKLMARQVIYGTGADTSYFREYQFFRNSFRMVKMYSKWVVPVGIYAVWMGYDAFPLLRKDMYEFVFPPPEEKKQ